MLDGLNQYLNTTYYYDDDGRIIQTLSENYTKDDDIVTNQYHWDGRLLSSEILHSALGTTYNRFGIITKNIYDKIGRVQGVEKKVGTNNFYPIVTYDYDDLGRVKTKHLDPSYTGTNSEQDIETLNYSYTMQGQLGGINKDYALKTPGLYNKWGSQQGKFFGLYIGYDKKEWDGNLFNNSLLTGQVAAQVWNTVGDDVQRKYEYTYDAAGRFTSANFYESKTESYNWENTRINFSVGGNSADDKIEYDLNGNILGMWQNGVLIGRNNFLQVDKLSYKYEDLPNTNIHGNRLQGVTDGGALNSINPNEQLGDFKDFQNADLTSDYVYDGNGNLVIDLNKGLKDVPGMQTVNLGGSQYTAGIKYNYFDKPEKIHIDGKGTINFLYDADGNKLLRTFESEVTGQTTATTYLGAFVYSSSYLNGDPFVIGELSYINFEEGRIRVMTNVSTVNPAPPAEPLDFLQITGSMQLPGNKNGVYDFYIKDNLQNTRMIVTEEEHTGKNTCTMETSRTAIEQAFSYSAVVASGQAQGWTNSRIGSYITKLNKTGVKLGPNTLLKVMAGDVISAKCDYFYNETPSNIVEPTTVLAPILNGLVSVIVSSSTLTNAVKDQVAAGDIITPNINTDLAAIVAPNSDNGYWDPLPKAYLTILFFDERFNFVEGLYRRVSQAGDGADPIPLPDNKAPKNGYVYVYVSNESDKPVYFDNLEVVHTRGRLIEENHYYPFGLKIATISSIKAGDALNDGELKNKHQYQGDYSEFDDDLGWNDFALRSYDPQIGRWLQNDPYDEFSSGYVGMGNDPVNSVDPTGGSVDDWFKRLNEDGSLVYQYFPGMGNGDFVGEGWEWAGDEKKQIKSTSNGNVTFDSDGYVSLSEVSIRYNPEFKVDESRIIQINTDFKCHITNTEVNDIQWQNINDAYSKLDLKGGQLFFPTNKVWNYLAGGRIYDGATHPVTGEKRPLGGLFDDGFIVNADGYVTEKIAPRVMGGTAPGVGIRGVPTSIWTSTTRTTSVENAFQHFKAHGKEFSQFYNAKQYVEGTRNFLINSPSGTLVKFRANGDILKYHPSSNTFGVMNSNHIPRTMFKPTEGLLYWLRQQ